MLRAQALGLGCGERHNPPAEIWGAARGPYWPWDCYSSAWVSGRKAPRAPLGMRGWVLAPPGWTQRQFWTFHFQSGAWDAGQGPGHDAGWGGGEGRRRFLQLPGLAGRGALPLPKHLSRAGTLETPDWGPAPRCPPLLPKEARRFDGCSRAVGGCPHSPCDLGQGTAPLWARFPSLSVAEAETGPACIPRAPGGACSGPARAQPSPSSRDLVAEGPGGRARVREGSTRLPAGGARSGSTPVERCPSACPGILCCVFSS